MRKLVTRIVCGLLSFMLSASAVKTHTFRSKRVHHVTERAALALPAEEPITPKFHCDQPPELPHSIETLLNQYYPGWRFPDISNEDCQMVKQNGGPNAYPEMIQGDFNDDGYRDYSVLIEQDVKANDQRVTRALIIPLVAFFRTRGGYRMQQVTDEGGGCLQLMPKGTRGYDYDAQREFTYPRDTIFSGFGMGGTSYLYENRKFRAIITSD